MILQQKYRSVNNFSEKIHRLFMKFLCNLSTFSLSVLLNFMPSARSFEQYAKKRPPKMICTPKVGQTLGGAYFYVKRKKISNKILVRIQDSCYNGYARKPHELQRDSS